MKKNVPFLYNYIFMTMKYSSLILGCIMLGFTIIQAHSLEAQSLHATTIKVNIQDKTLKQVFKDIEGKCDYRFVYSDNTIPENQRISVRMEGSLYDILKKIAQNTFTTYEQEGKNIIVTYHPPQQSGRLEGTVTDEKGAPLIGASVKVVELNRTTSTDQDGAYSLSLPKGIYTIEVSYVSFEMQRKSNVSVEEAQSTTVHIALKEALGTLSEVVVVGYGTQKKVNLTGAVDQVGPEVFEGRVAANATQMLAGVVPNLNIDLADGKPTRNPSYNVRGTTSIGQGGSALVLIDGVEGDPGALNPSDIESVSVLKDASSAAVYGSRGTFGVILITTKKAAQGKTSFTYSGNTSLQKQSTRPDFVTDGYTYAERFYEAYNAWNNYSSVPARLNKTQMFTLDWLEEFRRRKEQGITEEITVNENGEYVYYGNEDYYKVLLKDQAWAQDHNLSVSGTTDKADFYLSGRLYDYGGIYRYNTDQYKSYNMRAKGGLQVTDWLTLNNNMDYSSIKYHDPQTAGEGGNIWRNIADEGHPSSPIFNPDGSFSYSAAYTVGDFIYGKNGVDSENANLRNTSSFETRFFDNAFHVRGDLTFRNRDFSSTRIRVPVPYSINEGEILMLETSLNDNIYEVSQKYRYLFANLYADYEKTFKEDHYFKGLIGYNYEQRTYNSTYITKNGLLTENTENINLALGESVTATAGYNKYRIAGVFFRANYIYKDRYLFELNGRYDGSSKFPTNEQWAFFPSASLGWRISQESFWNVSPNAISDLKIRASYGSLGNGNIDPYTFLDTYSISTSGRVLNGQRNPLTSAPAVIPDNLTWETARTANIGLDISALNNKLTFTGDLYTRKTLDMYTVGQTLPDVFGAASPKGNYADMTTKGFEISLSYNDRFDLNGKPFGFGVKVGLADYRSTIDKYNNSTGVLTDYYAGQRVGEIWGYVTQGLFQSQEEIDGAPSQTLIKSSNSGQVYPGDIRFADLDGNGVIDYGANTLSDHGDKTIIGNSDPRYIYNFNLNASYSGFFLSAFFQGVGKQDWYPGNEAIFWGQYNRPYNNLPTWHLDNYWTEDNRDAYLPRYAGYNTSFKETVQTRYLQNVAYIRLRNLQVGYNLPQRFVSKFGMQNIRVGLTGENLWTWSPLYKHTRDIDVANIGSSDPDIGTGSGQGFNYPTMRSVSFNLMLNF
ncbi:SusC/RagA family TonB-linked outer membrane protein [Olivibacter sitiensis]|uniref:SusC/RagA family TonB-linked outer membrane protein n=1 Tax=Olivibacter sitiensis TaxID=376470 RepID=UPI000405137D|nr:SusC/RagA family TonB-linked outer membrane protein [Olivibacter sitiensis]